MNHPRYKMGDKVWKITEGKAQEYTITGCVLLENSRNPIQYTVALKDTPSGLSWYYEKEIFSSKADLLNSL